jgi:hypothetical protein
VAWVSIYQIASIDIDAGAGDNIIAVLDSVASVLGSTMIRHILDTIRLLGTTYVFMIPSSLGVVLNRVKLVNKGTIILSDKPDLGTMLRLNGGFNVIGDRISEPRYLKAFANTVARIWMQESESD